LLPKFQHEEAQTDSTFITRAYFSLFQEGIRKEIDVTFVKNPLTTKSLGSPINTDPHVQQYDRGKSQKDGTVLKRVTQ